MMAGCGGLGRYIACIAHKISSVDGLLPECLTFTCFFLLFLDENADGVSQMQFTILLELKLN